MMKKQIIKDLIIFLHEKNIEMFRIKGGNWFFDWEIALLEWAENKTDNIDKEEIEFLQKHWYRGTNGGFGRFQCYAQTKKRMRCGNAAKFYDEFDDRYVCRCHRDNPCDYYLPKIKELVQNRIWDGLE